MREPTMPRGAGTLPLAVAILVAVVVALPNGWTAGPAGSSTGSRTGPSVWTDAVGVAPGSAPGALPGGTLVSLSVTLAPRDPSGLSGFLAAPRTGSGGGPSRLTETQFEATFAPSASSLAIVEETLRAAGATQVVSTPDRLGVRATLAASDLESLLGVRLDSLGDASGNPSYTSVGTPTLPPAWAGLVTGIGGLSNVGNAAVAAALSPGPGSAPSMRPSRALAFALDNTTGVPAFIGSDYTQAYGVADLFPGGGAENATFPTSEAVATVLLSGFNDTTQQDLPGFDPVAVDAYYNDTFPASWPHPEVVGVPVGIDNVTPPAPSGDGALADSSLDETENALDLEMAGSLAPGAEVANFYFPGSLLLAANSTAPLGDVADDFATTLATALSYNYSTRHLAVVSSSFGLPDLVDSLWNTELLHAAALGVTVVAASGDQGDAPSDLSGRFQGQWPDWPGTAALTSGATVAVGGTTVSLDGTPVGNASADSVNVSFDPTVSGVASATAWYDTLPGPGNLSGSEGGISAMVGEPTWQFDSAAQPAIVNATVREGLSALGRGVPDVAFSANTTVAYTAHDAGGVYFELLEGTSIAAPLFAGFLASCAAVAGHPFGALDPELYRIASYYAAHPGTADPFEDVTTGANYWFSAAPGWDPVTGWGSLVAGPFLAADADPAVRNFTYTGPTPGLPPPLFGGPYTLPTVDLVILGASVAVAVVAVLWVGRGRTAAGRPPPILGPGPPPPLGSPRPPPIPPGVAGPAPVPGAAQFLCPYCGRPRPAEPVRCPGCGAF